MLVLGVGDSLRGIASVAAVIDYSFHGYAGTTISLLAEGQLPSTDGELYPAAAIAVVKSMVLVNTHSVAVTINLTLLKSGSTARRLVPKDLSLGIGYSLYFEGSRFFVINDSGQILNVITLLAHATTHQNGGSDEVNVVGLSGELADAQPPKAHDLAGAEHNADTLANLNLKISDAALGSGGVLPINMAKAYPSANINLTSSTPTKITYNTELFDVGGNYDAANSKYIVPAGEAGYYSVEMQIYMYLGTGASLGYGFIYLNGASVNQWTHTPPGAPDMVYMSWIGHLDATDYIEGYCQKNAADWVVLGSPAHTWFAIRQLTRD